MEGAIMKAVEINVGEAVEELSDLSFKELQKVKRGITLIENVVGELMADKLPKEED